jgi:glycosyltransferase involved in cell wall biosynthesis
LDQRASTFSYALGKGLNIGFLAMSYAPDVGGVQTLMTGLAREFRRLGHQVFVLCLDMSGQQPPFSHREEEVEGVRVRRVAYAFHDHRRLADLMRHKQLEDVVLAWLAEVPCDVIHVQHLSGFGAGALSAIHSVGQPLVLTLHDYWLIDPLGQMYATESPTAPDPEDLLNAPPFGWAVGEPRFDVWVNRIRACWPHLLPSGGGVKTGPEDEPVADDIETVRVCLDYALKQLEMPTIVLSPSAAAAEVFARAGVTPGRIRVCENGVDVGGLVEAVAEQRALLKVQANATGQAPQGLKLGILGSVLPSKGALEFVQAFIEAHVPGLTLEIHGNQPPYHGDTRYLERLRRLSELYPRVRLHGPYDQDQLPRILAGLDGVAAPSRWEEVFGLTVREARAAGLPILVSDTGALAAAAEGGLGGWIVARDDRAAWVAAIREFASDSALRQSKAQHAIQPHSLEAMSRELLRHYAQAIFDVTGRDVRAQFAPSPSVREAEKRAVELELGSEHSSSRLNAGRGGETSGLLGKLRRWLAH